MQNLEQKRKSEKSEKPSFFLAPCPSTLGQF
jgi:hypothetical protein